MKRLLLILAFLLTASVAGASIQGQWKFNEVSGTFQDTHANNNDLVPSGTTWSYEQADFDAQNKAARINGTGTAATGNNPTGLDISGPGNYITIGFRFYVTTVSQANTLNFVAMYDGGFGVQYLVAITAGTPKLYFCSGFYATAVTSATTITLDTWHYAIARWDGTNLELYLDGSATPDAQTAFTDGFPDVTAPLGINNSTGTNDFRIDDLQIANDAATSYITDWPALGTDLVDMDPTITITNEVTNEHVPELYPRVRIRGSFYNGSLGSNPPFVQARIVDHGTSNAVTGCDWRNLTSSYSGTTFDEYFTANIPAGGAYDYQVRRSDSTSVTDSSAVDFQVGPVWAVTGQSLAGNMFHVTRTTSPHAQIRTWEGDIESDTTRSWLTSSHGEGITIFLNAMRAATGKPCAAIYAGKGGCGLGTDYLYGKWSTEATYNTYFRDQVVSAINDASYIDGIIYIGSETDEAYGDGCATYTTAVTTVNGYYENDVRANVPVFWANLGSCTDCTELTDAEASLMRECMRDSADAYWFEAVDKMDATLSDGLHLDAAGATLVGNRFAQYIKYYLSLATYGKGPEILGYEIVDSTHVDIYMQHNAAGTDFTPTTDITGFDVTGAGVSVASAARQSSISIRLTITGDTADITAIRYQYGKAPTLTGDVFDNTAMALPLSADVTISEVVPDLEDPTATISVPTSSATYTDDGYNTLTVSGSAADNIGVTSITYTCDNCTETSGTATGTTSWSQAFHLAEGSNVIVITSHDAWLNTGTDTITVTYAPRTTGRAWYVDCDAGVDGDGTSGSPFNVVSSLLAAEVMPPDAVWFLGTCGAINLSTMTTAGAFDVKFKKDATSTGFTGNGSATILGVAGSKRIFIMR